MLHAEAVSEHPLKSQPSSESMESTVYYNKKEVEHILQKTDTLAGLCLFYGVKLIDIKIRNKLWTEDLLHCKTSIFIPNPKRFLRGEGSVTSSMTITKSVETIDALINQYKQDIYPGNIPKEPQKYLVTEFQKMSRIKPVTIKPISTDAFKCYMASANLNPSLNVGFNIPKVEPPLLIKNTQDNAHREMFVEWVSLNELSRISITSLN